MSFYHSPINKDCQLSDQVISNEILEILVQDRDNQLYQNRFLADEALLQIYIEITLG